MQKIWYGWIPILSSELLAENICTDPSKIFPKKNSDTKSVQEIDGTLSFDNNGFLSKIELEIPEICSVQVICNIKTTGLVSFNINPSPDDAFVDTSYSLPIFIFDIIRDIYHNHVHHGREDDCKLKPILAENENEAVRKIFNQYRNKIFYYLKDLQPIKNFFKIPYTRYFRMKKSIYLLETARGEFIYAKSFINLHKENFKVIGLNPESIEHSFDYASNSVSILREKFTWQIWFVISLSAILITITTLATKIIPVITKIGYSLYYHKY